MRIVGVARVAHHFGWNGERAIDGSDEVVDR